MLRAVFVGVLAAFTALAQNSVPLDVLYHRVWAVVPLIGVKGNADNPQRPMFVPTEAEEKQRTDALERAKALPKITDQMIVGYSMVVSDDGKSALVEFLGLTPASLRFIADSKAPGVKVFERGKATPQEIETEFKKYKANFKLEDLEKSSTAGRPANVAKGGAK